MKALNLLRTFSTTKWGADTTINIWLYQVLIRSKIDYGSIVYGAAIAQTLKIIDVISNEALRIITGAFKTSPISSPKNSR